MTPGPITLLIVDDHRLVRLGMIGLFGDDPRFEVVGEAATAAEAVANAGRVQPDVVLMDVRLPDGSGVEACREIRSQRPDTRVVMVTSYEDEETVVAAIAAGASGYVLKHSEPEKVIDAALQAAAGGATMDPATTRTVIEWMRRVGQQPAPDPLAALSDQERKVLALVADGKTNREIAEALYLSPNTVKAYVSSVLRKLDLTRRSEAVALIIRMER